ncbi:MAG: alpha/beta hydrolase [Aliidongia sp.]
MTMISVGGIRLEVARWPGRSDPILLLHEGLGSVSMWRDFPERLAAVTGHEVIAWSRRGHGASGPIPVPRDPDYMHREAALLPTLFAALSIDRAHCFGHSDGGSIALIAAAHMPERIASLTLEAPHVMVEDLTIASIAAVKATYQATDLRDRLGRHHADPDHIFWRWNDIWLDPRFRDWNIEALLPAIRAPTLLIQGRDDEYGTLDQLDRIASVLPRTRRLELDRCGHSPHRDQPQAVLDAVAAFLADLDG